MKHCPVCNTQYDEEILRFCTKDGTPLIEDDQPNFVAMPSDSVQGEDDDFGQETVIRRTPPTQPISEPPNRAYCYTDYRRTTAAGALAPSTTLRAPGKTEYR